MINALARVGNADAADNILSKMKQLSSNSEDNTLKPDTICYTSVIDACKLLRPACIIQFTISHAYRYNIMSMPMCQIPRKVERMLLIEQKSYLEKWRICAKMEICM